MNKIIITPEARLKTVLESYPELESVLIDLSPAFGKLKNPLLRRTVARVATLRQVAETAGLSVPELINRLRQAAGEKEEFVPQEEKPPEKDPESKVFEQHNVVKSYDARPVLEKGGSPLAEVLADVKKLHPGDVYELAVPFLPAPLIDKVKSAGCEVKTLQVRPDLYRCYFKKR